METLTMEQILSMTKAELDVFIASVEKARGEVGAKEAKAKYADDLDFVTTSIDVVAELEITDDGLVNGLVVAENGTLDVLGIATFLLARSSTRGYNRVAFEVNTEGDKEVVKVVLGTGKVQTYVAPSGTVYRASSVDFDQPGKTIVVLEGKRLELPAYTKVKGSHVLSNMADKYGTEDERKAIDDAVALPKSDAGKGKKIYLTRWGVMARAFGRGQWATFEYA